jgi:predicted glycosyltransferase
MRAWIDVLTPKQANLFSVFIRSLRERGHDVFVTTRRYREVEELLELRGIEAAVVGRHGGGDLSGKLLESASRIEGLARFVHERGPELVLSFCSPEAARVAYGLGIPHYALCDSPHAEAVCRLSIPLSRKLFTPRAVPKGAWKRYGIAPSDIVQYNALDPAVWIRAYAPGTDPRDSLGLDRERQIVVLRTEEEYASYLLQSREVSKGVVTKLVRPIAELGAQVVLLPRYERQIQALTSELANLAIVPSRAVDAVALLSRSSFFIGAGGTMNAEAALMGVPTISCFPSKPTYVDKYLFRLHLVERSLSSHKIVRRVRRFLTDRRLAETQKKKADRVLASMDDPLRVITNYLGFS